MKLVQSESAVSTKHEKLGKLEVFVETPQVTSMDDAISFFGGADNLLNYLNGSIDTSAKNGARAYLRGLPADADPTEAESKAKEIASTYSPQASASKGPSVKAKAQKLDEIKAAVESGKALDKDMLLKMLQSI